MKAAVVEGLGNLVVKDIPMPKIKNESILIKILACAVCGSDIRILDSGNDRVKYPAVIGHEIAGEVVEIGKDIKDFKVGDMVAVGADVPCGRCKWCQNGMGNCCDKNYAMGYQFQGGYAEYCLLEPMVMKYGPVCRISDGLDPKLAALAEPLACCINGLERVFFSAGKSLLVIGAGPIGVLLIRLAKAFGASKTILCDINPERLKAVNNTQADYLIDISTDDITESIKEITKGDDADLVFTACPSPDAQEMACKIVAKRGFVNLFGGLPKSARDIQINSNHIHYREAYITGSHGSTPRQHAMAMELITAKRIDMADLITHHFPLDEIQNAFDVVRKQAGLKVIILPTD